MQPLRPPPAGPVVSFHLRKVSLHDALQFVAELTNVRLEVNDGTIRVVAPNGEVLREGKR
mgnify:CR=1 FL=1